MEMCSSVAHILKFVAPQPIFSSPLLTFTNICVIVFTLSLLETGKLEHYPRHTEAVSREVCSYRFTFDQTKTVVEISKAYGCGLLLKYNDHSYLYNKSDEMFQVFNNIGLSRDAFIECPSMDHHREELPIGFTIRGCEEAKAILSGQKDQFRVELFHDVTECDVFSPYVNKMTGLKKLSHLLGLDSRQCIAFGDSRNDLEMIRWAGCGIAMGNACQELKDCADLVCGNSWENGIADAVGRIRAEHNSPHRLSPLIVVK